ncbi:MAG: type II secretion system F family protein [Pirellulaceae bacterium]|jgi:tight adherence protein C|nr:type II secretion system F family protein [Pirellulaceae bacterium]
MTTSLLLRLLISSLMFGSVFLLTWVLFRHPVQATLPIHRRIAAAIGVGQRHTIFTHPRLVPLTHIAVSLAQRFDFPAVRYRVRRDLDASGNPNGYSVEEFLAICLLTTLTLGIICAIVAWQTIPSAMPITTIVTAMLGFAAPMWSLHLEAVKRTARISKTLPYTLDLVALMMTAGCTFNEAVETLIENEPDDDLNQELRLMRSQIQFGTKRSDALAQLANRIPLETLRSIVGAINQSEHLGTPLATILKAQAGMIRMQRSVRAEKLSASASLRILIPSMLILIAAVLVVFAPFVRPLLTQVIWP